MAGDGGRDWAVAGFVSFPFVIRAFPFGIPAGMAATIMNADEWNAGIALMKSSSPEGWAQLTADTDLVRANKDRIAACREAATKSKKEERCTITVQSAAGS